MEKKKKLLLDDLINRATSSERDKHQVREYDSELLGGTLTFRKMPLSKVIDLIDRETNNMQEEMDLNVELIYKHCPMMQDKKLQEAYECGEPYDIVTKLFEDNLGEIQGACNIILSMYGLSEVAQDVKNS